MLDLLAISQFYVDFDRYLEVNVLLHDPLEAKFKTPGRGNQVFGKKYPGTDYIS
jgi:hypothetical protein